MTALLIGYARCSTDEQDLTVQREGLAALGVTPGPEVGEILKGLRAAQAGGHVRSRTGALRWLQGTVARGRGRGEAALTRPGKRGG